MTEALRIAALRKIADEYVPEAPDPGEVDAIRTVLKGVFLDAGEDAIDEFELPIAFRAADAQATLYGQHRGGELVTMILDTQRREVAELLAVAIAEGWSPQHFASELRQRFTFSRARAAMIARTEVAIAANRGKTSTYRQAGLEYVYVYDGDFDEACQAANGSIWTIDEADSHAIEHPNCKRTFRPATQTEIAEYLGNEQRRAA